MRKSLCIGMALLCAFALTLPAVIEAQSMQPSTASPPVEQPLVREGTLAVSLAEALGLASTTDEVEAETALGRAGISPRNGWIADYPVTPDIAGELQESVIAAADAGTIAMTRDDALRAFRRVLEDASLSVRPAAAGEGYGGTAPSTPDYPCPGTICNYYYNQGPRS